MDSIYATKLRDNEVIDFKTTTHGKWILAGEHAVLRGCPALVFPVPSKYLSLKYMKTDASLQITIQSNHSETLEIVFRGLIEKAIAYIHKISSKKITFKGEIFIKNTIPMGTGMGFSAALCAAMSQWLIHLKHFPSALLFHLSRTLENSFHGQSSGVDIIGATASKGVYFEGIKKTCHKEILKNQPYSPLKIQPIHLQWKPYLYLSYCNQISMTSHCVEQVSAFVCSSPSLGKIIDQKMQASVKKSKVALESPYSSQNLAKLTEAISLANQCFIDWGLIKSDLATHQNQLKQAGALTSKPTGAGKGGYVLSLWKSPPPFKTLPFELIQALTC